MEDNICSPTELKPQTVRDGLTSSVWFSIIYTFSMHDTCSLTTYERRPIKQSWDSLFVSFNVIHIYLGLDFCSDNSITGPAAVGCLFQFSNQSLCGKRGDNETTIDDPRTALILRGWMRFHRGAGRRIEFNIFLVTPWPWRWSMATVRTSSAP